MTSHQPPDPLQTGVTSYHPVCADCGIPDNDLQGYWGKKEMCKTYKNEKCFQILYSQRKFWLPRSKDISDHNRLLGKKNKYEWVSHDIG